MIKPELITILKKFRGITSNMLYNELIILDKENTKYNQEEYNKLIVGLTLINAKKNSYQISEFMQ